MKNSLLTFLILLFAVSNAIGQSGITDNQKQQIVQAKQTFKDVFANASLELDPFRVCGESFTWDITDSQFKKDGDVLLDYREMGSLKILTMEVHSTSDGEDINLKQIAYATDFDIFFSTDEILADSTLLYFGDGSGNFELISKTINHFNSGLVVKTEEFFDYTFFGFPTGLIKSSETYYEYDNNPFLTGKVQYSFDFFTSEVSLSDSIIYENNSMGMPLTETTYGPSFTTGEVLPNSKWVNQYINNLYISVASYFLPDGDQWYQISRSLFEYDVEDRILSIQQDETTDNGVSFAPTDRTLNVYESPMPYDLFTMQLTQVYDQDEWVNEGLSTFADCTSQVGEITSIDAKIWIHENVLYLQTEENLQNVFLSVLDINGRIVLNNFYQNLPDQLDVTNLINGFYVVQLQSEKVFLAEKVIK